MKYKLGNKVKVVKGNGCAEIGMTGTVAHLKGENIGVDFKVERSGFHHLDGTLKAETGYYVQECDIEIITEKETVSISFKAGMKMDTYVSNLLKIVSGERKKWLRTYQTCILPKEVESAIEEALTVVLRKDKFDEWGINDQFEKGLTNSILVYGPPGTGKTMLTECIAAILDKNLMKLDSGVIQSNIPGQTERNIEESFSKAKEKDCVILLDECDSLLYDRNSAGAIMSSEINKLLTEIERFDGVVVLTTNRLNRLDPALERRIISKIELPLPTEEARVQIWESLVPKKMPVKEVDYNKLAKYPLSGGDIKNCVLLAARKAIAKNKSYVKMKYFEYACDSVMKSKKDFGDKMQQVVCR